MASNTRLLRFDDAAILTARQFDQIELKPLFGLGEADVRGLHKKELATKMRLISRTYTPPSETIALINDGLAHMRSGLVGHGGAIYEDSITKMATPLVDKWPPSATRINSVAEFNEPIAVVANHGLSNYWHWHIQCLPTIISYREQIGADVRIVLPPLRPYQRESLAKLGLDTRAVVEVPCEYIKANRMYYCNVLAGAFDDLGPNSVSALVKVANATAAGPEVRNRRIYISRLDSTIRQCVNEIELIILLQSLGFEAMTLSLLSYEEQIRLFRSAEIVCGMHGAGLTNAGFGDPRTLVIELGNKYYIRTIFYAQSSLLNQSHTMFTSPTDESVGHLNPWTPNGMPWRIDAMRAARFIAETIAAWKSDQKR